MLRELYDKLTTRISLFSMEVIINVKRDDIVLITTNTELAKMLAEFDGVCGKIGLRLNLTKTVFMKNGLINDAPFTLPSKYPRML
uniref:Reverse transcriptase domain-containing protein n=1 Tax=Haemonchus contortus TaxID=6289 RepID=A0A7I5E5H2_HAECO